MANKRIIDLPSGSISDTSLTYLAEPVSGALSNTTYLGLKNYVTKGLNLSGSGANSYIALFSGSNYISSSNIFQSSQGSILIGTTTDDNSGAILQVSGARADIFSINVNGWLQAGDTTLAAITTYARPAVAPAGNYAEGFEEYSFVTAQAGFFGYTGVQSTAYVLGFTGSQVFHGKFTNYISAFSGYQVWDGSALVGQNNRLDNQMGYFSALNSQTGSVLNGFDIYTSEYNSVGATTLAPVVTNHYNFFAEPCTKATNNYGVFISGSQKNFFGGLVTLPHLKGGSTTPTVTTGSGVGFGTTFHITGSDLAGQLNIIAGGAPSASSIIATITFAATYSASIPYVTFSPASSASAGLTGPSGIYVTTTGSSFTFNAGATALISGANYIWNYVVVQ